MLPVDHQTPTTVLDPTQPRFRIGMVLDQPFPPDARVEREAVALTEAGYEVHLLCMKRPEDQLSEEFYRGFYIHRVNPDEVTWELPLLGTPSRLLYRGLLKNYFRRFKDIDTAWHTLIYRFVKSYGIQALHIHDLRLVHTGLNIARRANLPLVADLHENYPALMRMMKGRDNPQRGEKQWARWDALETDCAQRADRVIVVADEAKARLVEKGIPTAKIEVLENTVDVEKFQAAPVDPEVIRRFKSAFLLSYVGHLNDSHRGIQTVMEAMALLRDEIPELQFVGAGATREPYLKRLEAMVRDNGLSGRVHFTGWLDETGFVSYIEASDICLCPHLANDHTNATFPNKIYLYHLFRRPVIVSNAIPLRRYVEETHGGLEFESGNALALADRIRELYRDSALRKELAANGHRAVLEKHNWRRTAQTLVAMYGQLAQGAINRAGRF